MNQVEYKTYLKLRHERFLTEKVVPKSVLNSHVFKGLMDAGIIEKSRSGRGFRYVVTKSIEFESFFKTHIPEDIEVHDKTDNVRKFRNSKVQKILTTPIFMLRGFTTIRINGHDVDLNSHTQNFGLFACNTNEIEVRNLCVVENLDTFLVAEKLLGTQYVYLHKYGRIGKESLSGLNVEQVLVFVDFDFNGLEEFLRIKEVFGYAQLFVPENYDELFAKYARSLKDNKAEMTVRIKQSNDEHVVKIRESVLRNNRFLEQQYWKND